MRLIIAEDFIMARDALSKACSFEFGHEVVAETGSGEDAVSLCTTFRPDVLLLDVVLQDIDGFSVVDKLDALQCTPKVIIVSAYCDTYTIGRSGHPSIVGFIDKASSMIQTVGLALAAIQCGSTFFSARFQELMAQRKITLQKLAALLTPWECVVLGLIGEGASDSDIGIRLQISDRTVQGHRSIIMRKLDIHGTPKLMAFAIEHGFSKVNPASSLLRTVLQRETTACFQGR